MNDIDLLETTADEQIVTPGKPFPIIPAALSIAFAILFVLAGFFGSQAQEAHAVKSDGCSQITVQGSDAFDRCMENWDN